MCDSGCRSRAKVKIHNEMTWLRKHLEVKLDICFRLLSIPERNATLTIHIVVFLHKINEIGVRL